MKFEMEHRIAPQTEEYIEKREARLAELAAAFMEDVKPMVEEFEQHWKRTVYIGTGAALIVGLSVGYIAGKNAQGE